MIGLRRLLAIAVMMMPVPAAAQNAGFVHRLEITGGVGYFTGAGLGDTDANLRANTPAQSFTLFATDTTLGGSLTGEARVGMWLTRRIGVEGRP